MATLIRSPKNFRIKFPYHVSLPRNAFEEAIEWCQNNFEKETSPPEWDLLIDQRNMIEFRFVKEELCVQFKLRFANLLD